MFSVQQKRQIADAVQRILRETGHPELPVGEISFYLKVQGAEDWSWADIRNNGAVTNPSVNPWNEAQAQVSAAAPAMVPVPVSERLPGEGDCDVEGRCWLLTVEDDYPQWRLHSVEGHQPGGRMIWVPVDRTPGVMVDAFYVSHWLPAHALPLPSGEVEG